VSDAASEVNHPEPARKSRPAEDDANRVADRRLRLIVYACLVAFLILASYGFYLIASLTRDMHEMTRQIAAMSPNVQHNMSAIATQLGTVGPNVDRNMNEIGRQMQQMSQATSYMAWATAHMQADMWSLNHNISKPLSFMNSWLPWSGESGPYPASQWPLPPPSGLGGYPPPVAADGEVLPPPGPVVGPRVYGGNVPVMNRGYGGPGYEGPGSADRWVLAESTWRTMGKKRCSDHS
jgi:hypothetical protein